MRDGWSRRAVLGTAGGMGVLAAAGCGWWSGDPPDPPPDPLEPLLLSAQTLAAGYQAALAAHPELVDRLDPIYQAHRAHETAIRELIGGPTAATPSPDTNAWMPPVTDGATPEEALAGLGEAERAGWVEARAACLAATAERVRMLGSIAAARAVHGEVLP